jgi:hypothetical protein
MFNAKTVGAQAIKLNINIITEAIIKINKLALLGKMGFFIINLKPSAKCCNNSNNPTTLGPFLHFIIICTFDFLYASSFIFAFVRNSSLSLLKVIRAFLGNVAWVTSTS